MDFKKIWHNFSPSRVDVPFETIVDVGLRSKVKVMWARHVVPHCHDRSCASKIRPVLFEASPGGKNGYYHLHLGLF